MCGRDCIVLIFNHLTCRQSTELVQEPLLLTRVRLRQEDELRSWQVKPGKAVAQSDSGTEEKDRRYKQVMAGEEWVLQFFSLLCGQTNIASGLNLSNWVCPLAEVWESLKECAKWLNGSGGSTLSLMGFTHSAPSGQS